MKNGLILGIAIGALAAATMLDRKKESDFFVKSKRMIQKKLEDMLRG